MESASCIVIIPWLFKSDWQKVDDATMKPEKMEEESADEAEEPAPTTGSGSLNLLTYNLRRSEEEEEEIKKEEDRRRQQQRRTRN